MGFIAIKSYSVQRTYDRAGHVRTQTYPSGHTVNYVYDAAGRTSNFDGNLGDGAQRTYASEFQYTESGLLQQEKFGTDIPLYHKQRYNQRGQLWDIRLSTIPFATNPADGDRGAIVNYYSSNFIQGETGTDNNGNLLRQDINVPGIGFFQDTFSYDSLNRLKSVAEKLNGAGNDTFKQAYTFDRWGNRTIDQGNTTANVPHPLYTVDPSNNNRLLAPAGFVHLYDAAGNQTKDTYTTNNAGGGQRTFDAENRTATAQQFPSGKSGTTWAYYVYDGDGKRVRHKMYGVETWSVYGMDGELLAEYPQQTAASAPQKEFGYRSGQLLVTGQTYSGNANVQWLVADQLNTPRMIVDKTGSLASVSRHDYLPFGEELFADTGGRTIAQGYTAADGVRQKFTSNERDTETGVDYFVARYYSSGQGRFTSVDPLLASGRMGNPQTWNRYAYVVNSPLTLVDPDGLEPETIADLIKRLKQQRENAPIPVPEVQLVTQIAMRPVFQLTTNNVSVFNGTFPSSGGNPANFGQPAVNPNGTSAVLPFGANISVDYTLTSNGVAVETEIFEEVEPEGSQVVREADGSYGIETQTNLFQGPVVTSSDRYGNFPDAPLGVSNAAPLTSATVTQTLYIMVDGQRRDLVVNLIEVNVNYQVRGNSIQGNGNVTVKYSNPNFTKTLELPPPTRQRR